MLNGVKRNQMDSYLHKKIVNIPIYGSWLCIILSNDAKLINKEVDNFGYDKEPYATAIYNSIKIKGDKHLRQGFYVILNPDNELGITTGVIAHEAFHISNMLFEIRGVRPSFDNDEPQAYFIEWVCDEVCGFMKKKGYDVK